MRIAPVFLMLTVVILNSCGGDETETAPNSEGGTIYYEGFEVLYLEPGALKTEQDFVVVGTPIYVIPCSQVLPNYKVLSYATTFNTTQKTLDVPSRFRLYANLGSPYMPDELTIFKIDSIHNSSQWFCSPQLWSEMPVTKKDSIYIEPSSGDAGYYYYAETEISDLTVGYALGFKH